MTGYILKIMNTLISVTTQFSIGESIITPDEVVEAAVALGYDKIAVIDIDNCSAYVPTANACKANGIIFSAGCQISFGELSDNKIDGEPAARVVAYPKSEEATMQIWKLLSQHPTERDPSFLAKLDAYVIVPHDIYMPIYEQLEPVVYGLKADHSDCWGIIGIPEAKYPQELVAEHTSTRDKIIRTAKELDKPLVAMPPISYQSASKVDVLRLYQAIQTLQQLPDREQRPHIPPRYVPDQEKIKEIYDEIFPGSNCWEKSQELGELLPESAAFPGEKPELPVPAMFQGKDLDAELRRLCYEGADARWKDSDISKDTIAEKLEHELKIITELGFTKYFLLMYEVIKWSLENNVPIGPGRGSACGSCVAYCLYLHDVDPIKYDLIFERFLNPSRNEMPDIDIDFADDRRDYVKMHLVEEYGNENVAPVGTFSRFKAKIAIRGTVKAHGYPTSVESELSKMVPSMIAGRDPELKTMLADRPPIGDKIAAKQWKQASVLRELEEPESSLIQDASELSLRVRHKGIHASAVMVSDKPIWRTVPIDVGEDGVAGPVQYDHVDCEKAGLLKLDCLGLSYVRIIYNCCDKLGIHPNDISLEDPDALKLIAEGKTRGVFQLARNVAVEACMIIYPDKFEDVVVVTSAIRPGPAENQVAERYAEAKRRGTVDMSQMPHKEVADLLPETYGMAIYQEQVMKIVSHFAGFSAGEADNVRKVMGKKKHKELAAVSKRFREGCKQQGYTEEDANRIWDWIAPFASYGFNRSHAVAYSFMSLWTAWLSCHHPAIFFAEMCAGGDIDSQVPYLREAVKRGVKIVGPTVEHPSFDCVASKCGEYIMCGTGTLKQVGSVGRTIHQEFLQNGPFESMADFKARLPKIAARKQNMMPLVASRFFEPFTDSREGALAELISVNTQESLLGQMEMSKSPTVGSEEKDEIPPITKFAPFEMEPAELEIEWYDS